MIVDAHNHIGTRKGLTFLTDDLLKQMDQAEIDRAVVFSMTESINNDYVAQAVDTHPDRLIGFVTINPWSNDAESELERYLNDFGMSGLKLHPIRHGFVFDDHFLLDPLFNICREHKVPVIAYGGADVASVPNHFEEMANTFPSVPFIMAHMGYMYETNSAIDVAHRAENVYLETSRVFVRQIQNALRKVGAEKIIFGTDTPKEEFYFSLEKVRMSTSDQEERALILGENLLNLLNK
jgi:predicted TIM-barrel fold metal-dependent hydrolase